MSRRQTIDSFLANFERERPLLADYVERLSMLLRDLLRAGAIDVVSVSGRVKAASSLREKIKRKGYAEPLQEVTDLCGLRIIAYLESDVDRVAGLVRSEFAVDEAASVDKRAELKPDQVGYRSLHLMCHLSAKRAGLAEYERFKSFGFALQIRTVLQHAWAQIEWGRNYKFGGVLPGALQRRLLLAAGALEILDREFSAIASEVDSYAAGPDEPVNSLVLRTLAEQFAERSAVRWSPGGDSELAMKAPDLQKQVVEELTCFGINTRRELEELLSDEFVAEWNIAGSSYFNEGSIFRDAMMWRDMQRYFTRAHRRNWHGIDAAALRLLVNKYDEDHIVAVLTAAGVEAAIEDDEDWTGLEEIAEAIAGDEVNVSEIKD